VRETVIASAERLAMKWSCASTHMNALDASMRAARRQVVLYAANEANRDLPFFRYAAAWDSSERCPRQPGVMQHVVREHGLAAEVLGRIPAATRRSRIAERSECDVVAKPISPPRPGAMHADAERDRAAVHAPAALSWRRLRATDRRQHRLPHGSARRNPGRRSPALHRRGTVGHTAAASPADIAATKRPR